MKVRELRKKSGLSQQSFAEKLGVGIATVQRWETGKAQPKRKALIKRLEKAERELKALLVKPERANCADCGFEVLKGGRGSERMILHRAGAPPAILCPACMKIRQLRMKGKTIYEATFKLQDWRRERSGYYRNGNPPQD